MPTAKGLDSPSLILLNLCYIFFAYRSEFVFINPNSKGQCGCGESFMTTGSSGASKQGGS